VGCGGNAIQFALTCHQVIAIDIDPVRLACARQNAELYGVASRIEFILGDATRLLPSLRPDVIFLSPPWGGPEYLNEEVYSMDKIRCPLDGTSLVRLALDACPNVAVLLPRHVDVGQLAALAPQGGRCEVEETMLNFKHKVTTAYYGDFLPGTVPSRRVSGGKRERGGRKKKRKAAQSQD
jgi:tRNA G10  N-methylase Trm11